MSVYTDSQKSVDDIAEAALVRLQHSPYRAIRRVSCRFEHGILKLHGKVPTFHHKQLAQTAVAGLHGVDRIDNQIDVT